MPRLCLTLCLVLLAGFAVRADSPIPRWARWEGTLTAKQPTDWRTEVVVTFTSPSGKVQSSRGFWDGGLVWKVRFRPDEKGTWRWRSSCQAERSGLDGQSGSFECVEQPGNNPLLRHGPVRVAGTYLAHADGTPFFWLGDTVWMGPALSTVEDWNTFLDLRRKQRFSVIQYNALSPWRAAPTDLEGRVAFTGRKDVQIQPEYFRRLDARIDAINAHGLLGAHVLIWALTQRDPGNYLPEEDVLALIRYQLARYGAHHLVWILAGDNRYNQPDRWKRLGRAAFGSGTTAPVTAHPTGMNWPWESWRDEKWLTLLGYQSGHGDDANTLRWIHSGPVSQSKPWTPPRPILNLEPPYEDHRAYQSRKPHSAYNVRRAIYWSLLNQPTAGVTYGVHGVWSWATVEGQVPPDHPGSGVARPWRQAVKLPGNAQMSHLADLFTSLKWWQLRPAQALLAEQPGGSDPARFVAVGASSEAAVLYLPVGGTVRLAAGRPEAKWPAQWFDPRTGKRQPASSTQGTFQAPDAQDWVLVLSHERP